MLAFVKGRLIETGTDYVVLDNQGIGYLIYTPLSVLENLPPIGQDIKIYTYMYVREDQLTLYGFLTSDDLEIFKLLIGVSGIGPKGALGLLSRISPNEFRFAVMSGDSKTIAKAPGIGPKTAQKLIIELKDKLKLEDMFQASPEADADVSHGGSGAEKETIMALVALGYSETEAFRAVQKADASPETDSETLLKLALKQMLTF